ncbi:MAG: hypothetical protein GF364_16990 [Candidatus Lokiarchaeota archaeon]|nr:hypothetical protein [Candidatus Lokiarchaeota archaeon]
MEKDITKEKSIHSALVFPLLVFLGFVIYITIYLLKQPSQWYGFSKYIPGEEITDVIILDLVPFVATILCIFIAMLVTPVFILFAKVLKGGKYQVAVQNYYKKFTGGEILNRAFFASLFAISLSLFLNNTLYDLSIEFIEGAESAYSAAALSVVFAPIAVIFMFPAWFLEDCGIVFFRKTNYDECQITSMKKDIKESVGAQFDLEVEKMTQPYDITSVGTFYGYLLRGFASITTPIFYIYNFIADIGLNRFEPISIVLMLMPFFLTGMFMLPIWLYLKTYDWLKRHLLSNKKLKLLEVKMSLHER